MAESPKGSTKGNSEPGSPGEGRPGEVRLPAAAAVVIAAVLYAALPSQLLNPVRFVVPAVAIALLVPLVAANPYRMNRENRGLRILSLSLAALLALANTGAFVALVHSLLSKTPAKGTTLLAAALQIWLTNIIAFGILYWELDRGGPVARARSKRQDLAAADFRFSQDEDDDAVDEVARLASGSSDWRPRFLDYVYVSLTNSTAFSPTDTMPLSHRAKALMAMESVEALLVSVLVIARGVSLLQ